MSKSKMSVRPTELIIKLSDGSDLRLQFTDWKPSRASGRLNANAISKMVVDGRMVQLGCNMTVLD